MVYFSVVLEPDTLGDDFLSDIKYNVQLLIILVVCVQKRTASPRYKDNVMLLRVSTIK